MNESIETQEKKSESSETHVSFPPSRQELDPYLEEDFIVDVTAASQILCVSLARLSQLTGKSAFPHLRRRVGPRWRLFYREKDLLAWKENQKAIWVTPALASLTQNPPKKDQFGAQASETTKPITEETDPFFLAETAFSEWKEEFSRKDAVKAYVPSPPPQKRVLNSGYGVVLPSAETLQTQSEAKIKQDGVLARLENMEAQLEELQRNVKALLQAGQALPALSLPTKKPQSWLPTHLNAASLNSVSVNSIAPATKEQLATSQKRRFRAFGKMSASRCILQK
jgi:hypothetical protein